MKHALFVLIMMFAISASVVFADGKVDTSQCFYTPALDTVRMESDLSKLGLQLNKYNDSTHYIDSIYVEIMSMARHAERTAQNKIPISFALVAHEEPPTMALSTALSILQSSGGKETIKRVLKSDAFRQVARDLRRLDPAETHLHGFDVAWKDFIEVLVYDLTNQYREDYYPKQLDDEQVIKRLEYFHSKFEFRPGKLRLVGGQIH